MIAGSRLRAPRLRVSFGSCYGLGLLRQDGLSDSCDFAEPASRVLLATRRREAATPRGIADQNHVADSYAPETPHLRNCSAFSARNLSTRQSHRYFRQLLQCCFEFGFLPCFRQDRDTHFMATDGCDIGLSRLPPIDFHELRPRLHAIVAPCCKARAFFLHAFQTAPF